MILFEKNFSEETQKALRENRILSICEDTQAVEFQEGLTVAKFYIQRQGASMVMDYSSYGICNEQGDLVCYGDEYASLEPYIINIKQFGHNFLIETRDVKNVKTRIYATVDLQNKHLKVIKKDGVDLSPTSNADIAIASNGRLYSFKKNNYITRNYHNIEEIEKGKYFVVDKISSTEEDGYVDYFMFVIEGEDERVSTIYSHLENDKYKINETRDMDYDKIRQMRVMELNELTFNEKSSLAKTKSRFKS